MAGIPEKHDDITAQWLTAALRSTSTITNQSVVGFKVEPLGVEYGRSSSIAIIRPTYDVQGHGPGEMLVKLVSQVEGNREFVQQFNVFQNEIHLYRDIGGSLPVSMPDFYFGAYEDDADLAILILEVVHGRRTGDLSLEETRNGLGDGTQRVALKPLANMHGQWWRSHRLDELEWLQSWDQTGAKSFLRASGEPSNKLRDAVERYLSGDHIRIYDAAQEGLETIDQHLKQMPTTLCHGNFHAQNMLWDSLPEAEQVTVVDWQLVNRGPAVRDVAYFLGITTSKSRDSSIMEQQVRFYHSELAKLLESTYSLDEFMEDLRPAVLEHIVRFQVFFSSLDFALPNSAEFAGTIFGNLCEFARSLEADKWLERQA